jgi:hypothetical protein
MPATFLYTAGGRAVRCRRSGRLVGSIAGLELPDSVRQTLSTSLIASERTTRSRG